MEPTYGSTSEQRLRQEVRELRARVVELETVAQSIRARLIPYTAVEEFANSFYASGIKGTLRDLAGAGISQVGGHLT